jgi:O-antigen ligase
MAATEGREAVLTTVASVAAAAGFTFMSVEPFIALYIVLLAGLAGLILALLDRNSLLITLPSVAVCVAVLLLAATIPFVWKSEQDLMGVVVFLPLLSAPGLAYLFARDIRWVAPLAIPILALIGTLAGLGGGLFERYVMDSQRVGLNNNPIHFAGLSVILGYVAMSGVASGSSAWRFLFLLGPAAALVVVTLTGSRGPLLAWVILAVIGLVAMLVWFWRDGIFWVVALMIAGVAIVFGAMDTGGRAGQLFSTLLAYVQNGEMILSDQVRLVLYQSAWDQFQASPLFGHGMGQLFSVAGPRLAELSVPPFDHLHSDLADFAVLGGSMGLVAYALLLLAPILAVALRPDRQQLLVASFLVIGYFSLGLTNAMLGILAQTVFYALVLGWLIARAVTVPTQIRTPRSH